jgi:DNA-binding GntR family transcriptional regulator
MAAQNQRQGLPPLRTTPDLIADELRAEITRGEPPPGHALRQEELAARFGVSRLPIREALRRLEAEGLVVVHPNRGAYVSQLDADQVREIYDLRILLEGDLLVRSIKRMKDDDIRAIENVMLRAERQARGQAWSELDDEFHAALYEPAARPRQLAMAMSLRGTVKNYQHAHAALPASTREWLRDHRALVDACRNRDSRQARRHLEDHLERAAAVVISRL